MELVERFLGQRFLLVSLSFTSSVVVVVSFLFFLFILFMSVKVPNFEVGYLKSPYGKSGIVFHRECTRNDS